MHRLMYGNVLVMNQFKGLIYDVHKALSLDSLYISLYILYVYKITCIPTQQTFRTGDQRWVKQKCFLFTSCYLIMFYNLLSYLHK